MALLRRSQTADERAQANASQPECNAQNRSVDPVPVLNLARRSPIRRAVLAEMLRAAFNYNSQIDYNKYGYIGMMDAICLHCDAANFPGETLGMCCANGKVRLPTLETPPEPLFSFIFRTSQASKQFLSHIQQYNSPFQMTSFGPTKIIIDNSMATFKIQIHHQAGSLLPYPDAVHQFLQNYFIGDENRELDQRCAIVSNTRREIIRVSELDRGYDALQYPILHWKGDDGYNINIPMVDTRTGLHVQKKVSAMNFYSYRLMVRPQEQNYIFRCKLYHQYIVDMYAKIATERLNFIRFNQAKLRSEEYIHLRDAITNDANVYHRRILVAPWHMNEYAQDAMPYIQKYGRLDLFTTFTCNPKWDDIKNNLFEGQSTLRFNTSRCIYFSSSTTNTNAIRHYIINMFAIKST